MPSERIARSIRFDPELWDALEEEARERKRSVNNLLEVIAAMAVVDPPEPLQDEISRRLA